MHESFSLGRIGGMKVGAHWSLPLVVWLIAWSLADTQLPAIAPGYASASYWLVGGAVALIFFGCLLAHEVAHSLVARHYGVEVRGIVLWLFGGVSQIEGDLPGPTEELRMAIAGPATSGALALTFFVLTRVVGGVADLPLLAAGLGWLGWMNGLLAAFNLVPAFPLDGGRVLRAVLWRRQDDKQAGTIAAARAGRVFGYLLIGFGLVEFAATDLLGGVWLVFLGWFLLAASTAEASHSLLETRLGGVPVSAVMTRDPVVVPVGLSVAELLDRWLYHHRCSTFPVVDPDGSVVGLVTLARLKGVPANRRATTGLAQIAAAADAIVRCAPDDPLVDVIARMNASADQRALVFDNGVLVGIVSPSDVSRVLERAELASGRMR